VVPRPSEKAVHANLGDCSGEGGTTAGGGPTTEEGTAAGGGTTAKAEVRPGGEVIRTVVIKESEFKLDPSNVTLDKPGTYVFKARNIGNFPHALEVEDHGVEAETRQLNAGRSWKLKVDFKNPGTYEMYCPVDGHRDGGQDNG
jgi:uncharacterized cupredoxin-like copper-binding protein